MNQRLIKNLKNQFLQKKLALVAAIIIVMLTISSIFAFLSPYNPNTIDLSNRLGKPDMINIFGTDDHGRDYFTRALYGGRVSLTVGLSSMLISTIIGTVIGALSGYLGGRIDNLIMRTIDILMSIPTFFLILILNAYLKPGIQNIIIIIGVFSWMGIARIVRAETLSIKEREYVLYSEVSGEKSGNIILKHIIPNIFPTIIVASTINIASAILTESSLSFLGLGVQQPNSSWGSMLKNAQAYIGEAPFLALFPGMLILFTVLSFNVLGDIFRVAFEPKVND